MNVAGAMLEKQALFQDRDTRLVDPVRLDEFMRVDELRLWAGIPPSGGRASSIPQVPSLPHQTGIRMNGCEKDHGPSCGTLWKTGIWPVASWFSTSC